MKNTTSSTSTAYYTEIDYFPLVNWSKCCKGELIHCRIDVSNGSESQDKEAWEVLFNDFIKKVGLGDEYNDYISLLKERANLQLDYLENRNRRILNEINLLTNEIESYKKRIKSDSEGSITKTLNFLSKKQGYQIDIRKITTLAYFELIKEMSTSNGSV